MNNLDIDDILSAVNNMNNGESVQNILGDLHHRSPVVKTSDSNPSAGDNNNSSRGLAKQIINRPVDPTGSVSSSDNSAASSNVTDAFGIADDRKMSNMKQMLQSISNGQSTRQIRTQKVINSNGDGSAAILRPDNGNQSSAKKKIVTMNVPSNPADENTDDANNNDDGDNDQNESAGTIVPTGNNQKSHMTSLMGYNIPTSTLYFIIVMVIIAVAVYFLTAEKKKDKEKEKDKQKKKEPE